MFFKVKTPEECYAIVERLLSEIEQTAKDKPAVVVRDEAYGAMMEMASLNVTDREYWDRLEKVFEYCGTKSDMEYEAQIKSEESLSPENQEKAKRK